MAVGNLAGHEFAAMQCRPANWQEEVELFTRKGVAGVVVRKNAKKPVAFFLVTQADVAGEAAAKALDAELAALAGTLVDFTDAYQRTYANVLVVPPVETWIQPAACVVGGVATAPTHIVHLSCMLVLTEEYTA